MTGNTLTRSIRGLSQIVQNPADGAKWVRDRLSSESPLEQRLPWVAWPSIRFLSDWLQPGFRVFEWGGGGSTVFFLDFGCHVTTIENSRAWADRIRTQVSSRSEGEARLDLKLIEAEGGRPQEVKKYVQAVFDGHPWDLILVDGVEENYLSRVQCVEMAASAVRPGGAIVLDDAWRPAYASVPSLLSGFRRRSFRGFGPARLGVTQTDIYFA